MTDRLIIVDAANVVGSVPDGWWRDRAGAATRLRDRLAAAVAAGTAAVDVAGNDVAGNDVTGGTGALLGGGAVVLVVEGRASGVPAVAGVRVVAAAGSGDDAIVDLVRAEAGRRRCLVVTADRALRGRVADLGADVTGPGALLRELGGRSGS